MMSCSTVSALVPSNFFGQRILVLGVAGCLSIVGLATPIAQRQSGSSPKNPQPTLGDQRRKDIQAILALADDLSSGQPVPNELALTWVRDDFFKAQDNKQYIPFTVTIDATKLTVATGQSAAPTPGADALEMYWRVVGRSAAASVPSGQSGATRRKSREKTRSADYAYEDITPVRFTLAPPSASAARSRFLLARTTSSSSCAKAPRAPASRPQSVGHQAFRRRP